MYNTTVQQQRYIRAILAAIYIMYCGVVSSCIHTHIIDGTVYVHFHPHNDRQGETKHTHNNSQMEIILFGHAFSCSEVLSINELRLIRTNSFVFRLAAGESQRTSSSKLVGKLYLRPPPFGHLYQG